MSYSIMQYKVAVKHVSNSRQHSGGETQDMFDILAVGNLLKQR